MNAVFRARGGNTTSSNPSDSGGHGWTCTCGNSESRADWNDQDAALAARHHALRCGRPRR